MRTLPAVLAFLSLSIAQAYGQDKPTRIVAVDIDGILINVGPMADNAKTVQWKVLAKHKQIDSPKALAATARQTLKDADKLEFDFQRVEFAGVASTDDTQESLPDMFDKQVKPSHINEVLPSQHPYVDAVRSFFSGVKDMREAVSDTRGNPSPRSAKMIAQLKGAKINELFAHSWGTEIVYLGILRGEIIPPKKLFIVGVPEDNQEKWLMLAKYTGIEVHVVGFQYDKLKIAGTLATQLKSDLPRDYAGLNNLWGEQCAKRPGRCADPANFVQTKFDYNVGLQPPGAPKDEFFKIHPLSKDHDRLLYYQYLHERGLFDKTAAELDAPQLKLVQAEENKMLASAMVEARTLIAEAKAQVRLQEKDSDERRKNIAATPMEPVQLNVTKPSLPAEEQKPIQITPLPKTPFEIAAPEIRAFAIAACRSPVPAPTGYYSFTLNDAFYEGLRGRGPQTGMAIQYSLDGLTGCSRSLYLQLISMIYEGSYWKVSSGNWLRDTVASYSSYPQPWVPQGQTTPQPKRSNSGGNDNSASSAERPTPEHDADGEALRQLKAMDDAAMRKRFGLPP